VTGGTDTRYNPQRSDAMRRKPRLSPFMYPIVFFGLVILAGAAVLYSGYAASEPISWLDAMFTATSATCVTGLVVVDTGSFFNGLGQAVILVLIQLGGLGIMTLTSLVFILWTKRVSLLDRVAVGESLRHDKSFNLGKFLKQVVLWTMLIELSGAVLIYIQSPDGFRPFSALFHAVSAFCNAGFSLNRDSLMGFRSDWGINLVFMALIISGGIGFSVLVELYSHAGRRIISGGRKKSPRPFSWYATVVLRTSLALIVIGWAGIYFGEFIGFHRDLPVNDAVLSALFQSVTCRTAGFNSLDIGQMTNVSLLIMMVLMFVGGAPGSCAGGVKVTTFRTMIAFGLAQIKGREQTEIGRFAVDQSTLNKALVLTVFGVLILASATLLLNFTEGADLPHPQAHGIGLDILFEVVSAFGTVGLSTGLTPKLSSAGKVVIMLLMFIGRLGPILFLSAIQSLQKKQYYRKPEESLLIG